LGGNKEPFIRWESDPHRWRGNFWRKSIVSHCCVVCCKRLITVSQRHCCSRLQCCRLVSVTLHCAPMKNPPHCDAAFCQNCLTPCYDLWSNYRGGEVCLAVVTDTWLIVVMPLSRFSWGDACVLHCSCLIWLCGEALPAGSSFLSSIHTCGLLLTLRLKWSAWYADSVDQFSSLTRIC